MMHGNQQVHEQWNRDDVESMYDKHLLKAAIGLIKRRIPPNAEILDAGCEEVKGRSRTPPSLVAGRLVLRWTRITSGDL